MPSKKSKTVLNGLLVSASSLVLATFAPNVSVAEEDRIFEIEEIRVTANKREESLTDFGGGISAFTGDSIKQKGFEELKDIAQLSPNVTLSGTEVAGTGTFVIRGVTGGSGGTGTTATTAVYIDEGIFTYSGVWSGSAGMVPDADIADIERIEVIKGPQATLYGANAIGGLVRIITKKPDATEIYGSIEGEYNTVDGGGDGYSFRGSLNLPIVEDKLAIKLNGFHRRRAGVYDNVALGDENVDTADFSGGRAALRFTPDENLTVDLNIFVQDIETDGSSFEEVNIGTTTPVTGLFEHSEPVENLSSNADLFSVGGNIEYVFDGAGALTVAASYIDFDTVFKQDFADSNFAPFVAFTNAQPGATLIVDSVSGGDKKVVEARFASERLDAFEFIVGAFYTHENNTAARFAPILNPDGTLPTLVFLAPPPAPPFPFDGTLLTFDSPGTYEEVAGFASATFYINDDFDIGGGIRYSHNKQIVNAAPSGILQLLGAPTGTFEFTDDIVNYSVLVRWRPNEDTSIYARVADGYRPGGPNITSLTFPAFEPDTITNYEIGIKGSLADGMFNYAIAAYIMDWSNVQLPGRDPRPGGGIITANGTDATLRGFEAEFRYYPLDGLSITGSIGYNDTEIGAVSGPTQSVTFAAEDDPLPLTPKWSGSLDVTYLTEVSDTMVADFGATLKLRGEGNSGFPGSPFETTLDSATTLDLRAGVTIEENYRIALRVENVTNENNVERYTHLSAAVGFAVRQRPRTFVISGKVDF